MTFTRLASYLKTLTAAGVLLTAVGHGPVGRAEIRTTGDVPEIVFEKYTLPNGLEVILSEDHQLPLVGVNLWYHVGPAYEKPGRTGFAHLFEHMMFQGSKHIPSDTHFKQLEGAGATQINGTTGFDRTNYFATVPSNQLELALWLESDRMGYLLEKVDQANLSNQQDVVRNERRQNLENRPYGVVEEEVFHQLFPKGHPYYARVIGSHADIQAAQLDDIHEFFKLYYRPNNATLALAGDFDSSAAKKLIEKYFGSFTRGEQVPKPDAVTPPITNERRAVVTDRVELPRVEIAWLTPAIFKPGDAEADLVASVLGGGRSSRLYKKLVYEKQIAQSIDVSQNSGMLASFLVIEATARPGRTAEEIEKAVNEEVELFQKEGPTPQELERVRNGIETRSLETLQRLGGFGGVADRLNTYNHYLGDPGYLDDDIMRYRRATPDTVKKFAQDYLRPTARVVVHGIPGEKKLAPEPPKQAGSQSAPGGGTSLNADEPWRNTAPKPGASKSVSLPVPEVVKLANGLTLIYQERPRLPVMAASLVFSVGAGANPVDKPGLASFTASMLDEGTSTRSALQIADDAAQIGATLRTSSSADDSTVETAALTKNFARALELVADVALNASFPAEEVERQRKSRLGAVLQERENPAVVGTNVMYAALYGRSHPYGAPELGTEDSIKSMTRDELVGFWKQHFVPGNAALVVAGSMKVQDARSLVEKHLSAWKGAASFHDQSVSRAPTTARLVIVDKPGSPQTQLRVATMGAARSTSDYEKLEVMNTMLGGLFSSRINMNLREQHGYTYGARSLFTYRRSPGPFYVTTGVRTDVTAPAVQEIFKEIGAMADKPLSSEELMLSKDAVTRSLPGRFETNADTSARLATLFVYQLPHDYFSKLSARVQAVAAGDVQAIAAKYLAARVVGNSMIVVAVGDRAKIEPELRKLDIGPVEIRDEDGRVKPSTAP